VGGFGWLAPKPNSSRVGRVRWGGAGWAGYGSRGGENRAGQLGRWLGFRPKTL
jgi:hypothetical protein